VVIPPGVDLPPAIPDRGGRDSVTILAVGRLSEHKGQPALVRMIARLLEETPCLPVQLWLAGDDAGAGAEIAALVADHDLVTKVRVLGHCSDAELADLYRQADLFALPTHYESFGLVFIEALAYGLPVITYGVGPVPSILTQGALLATPGDERAFLAALRRLVQEPAERMQLGAEGRALVQSRYSWPATTDRFLHLYERAIKVGTREERRR
jgi:glycosyltransferase involved in cell wall biosynthesis